MKKRVLSLLLACFMVVSTFIISRPVVDVHAVENEAIETWTMPYDWSNGAVETYMGWDKAVQGQWKLSGYSNLDTATAVVNPDENIITAGAEGYSKFTTPYPYLATLPNEKQFNASASGYGPAGWYANYDYRWNGKIFQGATEAMYVIAHGGKAGAVTFTAPSDGVYSFTETVELLLEKTSLDLVPSFTATVRRNGTILATFTPETKNETATLTGSVVLKKDDVLMFAFQQNTNYNFNSRSVHSSNDPNCLKLTNVVVEQLSSELPETYKGVNDLTPVFTGYSDTSTSGLVAMKGYDMTTDTLYDVVMKAHPNPDEDLWLAVDPNAKNGWDNSNTSWNEKEYFAHLWVGEYDGAITGVGGAHENKTGGAALVFTAPNDGCFYIKAALGTGYTTSGSDTRYHDYTIKKGDGTVLASSNNVGKSNNYVNTVDTAVWLEKGEQVIILKTPNATSTQLNVSANGSAVITIKEVDHVCANSVKYVEADASCMQSGYKAHYACTCGVNYVDENATTVFDGDVVIPKEDHVTPETWGTSQTEHYKYCNNSCGTEIVREAHNWANGACTVCEYECVHTWDAETGACTNCGLGCTHTVTENDANCQADAVCETCGYTYKNPTNHVSNEFTYTEIDGVTHKVAYKCCGTEAPDGDCVYGNDNICDNCGYDKTVEVETEDVKNAIDNILNGGTADVTVVGPTTGMDANFDIEKPATTPADYEFKYLNIYFDENDNVVLRMTFIVTGEVTVTLNNNEATLKQDDGYNTYYLDVTPVAGEYEVANVVTVNGDTYNVSLYSYIKLALEGEVDLTDAEETLLRALYDLNEAMR